MRVLCPSKGPLQLSLILFNEGLYYQREQSDLADISVDTEPPSAPELLAWEQSVKGEIFLPLRFGLSEASSLLLISNLWELM